MSKLSTQRWLLGREVARLSEAECREVSEYIEVMRSLRREAALGDLFGEASALRRLTRADDEGRLSVISGAPNAIA